MELQLNLDKICRLCLEEKSEQLKDVFENENNLCENILHATTVKVEQGDGLPTHICQQCASLVNVIVNFQRKCVFADLALHHYIRKCDSHKEHKECEAVKFYPRDPLQLTRVIKTEGGPCQIKSETSVFQLPESREEVITGIIEEGSSNPRVNVKPEESESSIRTSKTVKGKQTKARCTSINCGQNAAAKVHKRRRRKGHRWKIKKQSSVNRKRTSGVHLRNTGPLQNTEISITEASIQTQNIPQTISFFSANKKLVMSESGLNRIISSPSSSATEEGLPNSSTLTVNEGTSMRGCVLKTRKSRNSNSIVASKNILLKEMMQKRTISATGTLIGNKNLTEENSQNKRPSQTSNAIALDNKTTEENLQNKTGSQNSNVVTVNKKTASRECQQNRRASDTSKTFLKSVVEGPASSQMVPQSSSSVLASQKLVTVEHIPIQTRNSFSRKPITEGSTQDSYSTANENPEMKAYIQTRKVSSPTRNLLRKKPAGEESMPNQVAQQNCSQKLEVEEHRKLQAENPSNKKSATTLNQKPSQSSKSVPANQKLVAEDQIQRKTLKSKPVTEESALNGNVVISATEKLVADERLQIQGISPMKKSLKSKPVMETSIKPVTETTTPTGNMTIPANEKIVAELMNNPILKKQVTIEPTPSQKVAANFNLLVDYKLVAEPHVRIQKVSPSRSYFINKPITEGTLNQSMPQSSKSVTATQKLVKQHAQSRRVSANRSVLRRNLVTGECLQKDSSSNINSFPTNNTPETAHNPALLPSSETFQADKLAEENHNDTFSASEKHLQGNNIIPTKRKTPEAESSTSESFSMKKQKTQENDRLTKLVIQVEGKKLFCSQCDSWFDDVEILKRHLEELHKKRVIRWHTVTGPGPEKDAPPSLLCASCGKPFTSQRLFILHQNQKSCF